MSVKPILEGCFKNNGEVKYLKIKHIILMKGPTFVAFLFKKIVYNNSFKQIKTIGVSKSFSHFIVKVSIKKCLVKT